MNKHTVSVSKLKYIDIQSLDIGNIKVSTATLALIRARTLFNLVLALTIAFASSI